MGTDKLNLGIFDKAFEKAFELKRILESQEDINKRTQQVMRDEILDLKEQRRKLTQRLKKLQKSVKWFGLWKQNKQLKTALDVAAQDEINAWQDLKTQNYSMTPVDLFVLCRARVRLLNARRKESI